MRYRPFGALALTLVLVGGVASCANPSPIATVSDPTASAPTASAPEAAASTKPARTPVVFVHGYLENPSMWVAAKVAFKAKGYTDADMVAISYDYNASVVDSAPTLAKAVDALLKSTGAPNVDIVSHSLGSFVTKQCIISDGCKKKVDHWMSISGVDNGTSTELAPGLPSNEDVHGRTPVRQYLQDHWTDLVQQGVAVEVQWSKNDGIVKPPELSKEPAPATDREVDGVPPLYHLVIPSDPSVLAETIKFFGQ
jgi:triacylglycerol lipase